MSIITKYIFYYKGWVIPAADLSLNKTWMTKINRCPFYYPICPVEVLADGIKRRDEILRKRCQNCIGNSKDHIMLKEFLESKELLAHIL